MEQVLPAAIGGIFLLGVFIPGQEMYITLRGIAAGSGFPEASVKKVLEKHGMRPLREGLRRVYSIGALDLVTGQGMEA